MTIGVGWWLVLVAGTVAAGVLSRRWPRRAAGVAVATFAVLVVAVAGGSAPAGGPAPAAPVTRHMLVPDGMAQDGSGSPASAGRPPAAVAPHARSRPRRARQPVDTAAVIRAYYAALDRGRFRVAWRRLSPSVRTGFGGFRAWRRGYLMTIWHRVTELRVDGAQATHELVAVDRTPCGGTTERRFAVAWRLSATRAADLTATKLAGTDPASAC